MCIMAAFTGESMEQIQANFAGKGYGDFKKAVADVVVEGLTPVRERYEQVAADKSLIEEALKRGNEAAQRRADKIMSKVYRKVGFLKI